MTSRIIIFVVSMLLTFCFLYLRNRAKTEKRRTYMDLVMTVFSMRWMIATQSIFENDFGVSAALSFIASLVVWGLLLYVMVRICRRVISQ